MASGTVLSRDAVLEPPGCGVTHHLHVLRPAGSFAVQIGCPADLCPGVMPLPLSLAPKLLRNTNHYQAKPFFITTS